MKRNKGFTILELIAIILVIALVLAISIPTVIGIIESTRRKAFGESAKLLVNSAVNLGADENRIDLSEITASNIKEKLGVKNTNYSYVEMTKENETNAVLLSLLIGKGQWDGLKACGTYRDMIVIDLNNQESCPSDQYTPSVEITGKFCGWEELNEGFTLEAILEAYNNHDTCYVTSVDDLVGISKLVNQESRTFENKTLLMVNNIDISNSNNYYADDSIYFGDINNDGVIETLFQEMTTGKGFRPIGTSINSFQGTLDGNLKTISNLYIKRPTESRVGLFGQLGTHSIVKGITILNADMTGIGLVGIISGINHGKITDSIVQGKINSDLLEAQIDNPEVIGIVSGNNVGVIDGVLALESELPENITWLSGGSIGPSNGLSENFLNIDVESIPNDINFYEYGLDTWIGGDNNSDGYYFDYNSSGTMVLRKVSDNPMDFILSGNGTTESPYLINNATDWKIATLRPNSGYVFKLTNDIDFTTNKFYQLGSYYIPFNGVLEGNTKTLSNINVDGYYYSGIIGYNNGTIKGLNINSSNVTGLQYVGSLTGYNNSGNIFDAIINCNVTGIVPKNNSGIYYTYIGGVSGYSNYGNIINVIMKGNIRGTQYYTGAIAGYSNNSGIKALYTQGVFTGGTYYNDIIGGGTTNTGSKRYVSSAVTGYSFSFNSKYTASLEDNINTYESVLDTWVGGDNDSSGYYFDYDNNNQIVMRSVQEYPMNFNLSGGGTESNPYLINNYDDWKIATLRPNAGYHFKLTADIDFNDKNFYALGSEQNPFNGTFNGDAYFLKNIVNKSIKYGGIFGYNLGTINAINITNLNQNSEFYSGGIAGYNQGKINEINLQGNINSLITHYNSNPGAGGIVGENYNSNQATIKNVLVNANISGRPYVGGLVGLDSSGIVHGIMEAGSVLERYNNLSGRTIGRTNKPYDNQYITASSSGVTKTGSGSSVAIIDGTVFNVSNYNNLTSYDTYNLDTRIGGDNDTSGYYFDYNNTQSDIIVKSLEREPILNIYANNAETEIIYNASAPVTNYFNTEYYLHPTHNASTLVTTCRLERTNAIITNINQIPLGRERVSCILSYTNEYGTTSSEPASTIFYHRLIISASPAEKVIDYGTNQLIRNDFQNSYFPTNTPPAGFTTVCRRAKDSAAISNTNQLPLGIDKVQCKLSFTNEYGTTNGYNEAEFTYKHQLYLSPKELQFSINYGQDSLISSYYNYNPELTGSDIVCKLGETVITNTNQLTTYGGNQVTCNRTYTNEYGSHSGPNSSILFTHYPPTIAGGTTQTVRNTLNKSILDYYVIDNKGYPNFTYTCRRARDNAVVSNINQLPIGINTVACTISDENVSDYSTAHTEFKHWYYPANTTYRCPNGYAVSWDDPDGTGEPVCRAIRGSTADYQTEELVSGWQYGGDRSSVLNPEVFSNNGCYKIGEYSQFSADIEAFNLNPTNINGWNDQTDGGTIWEPAGDESWADAPSCFDTYGSFNFRPVLVHSFARGPDPTTSGGTCNNSGTNDSGTTISPTLSGGKCQFN